MSKKFDKIDKSNDLINNMENQITKINENLDSYISKSNDSIDNIKSQMTKINRNLNNYIEKQEVKNAEEDIKD